VVTGTTGWHDRLGEVAAACEKGKGALLHAANFSIGVQLLFELNRRLARLMAGRTDYAVSIEETHHVHKRDRPSGTAVSLAQDIVSGGGRWTGWRLAGSAASAAGGDIPVHSIRSGEVTGQHTVRYTSAADALELRHEAFNRGGFAAGAVLAAEWLRGRTGVFTMRDLLASLT
jgi:4-hydroxy-tetrahydrodipicolinate reductase